MYAYVIPCLLGLEKLVSDEVRRLGLQDVRAENGRVLCRGTLEDCARLNINLLPFWDITSGMKAYLINSGLNILLFIPLGFILPLLWKEFRSRRTMCLTGFLLSLGIELAQLLNYRISDVDDLIMNTLGAFLGYELLMLLRRRKKNLLIQEQADGRKMFLAILGVVILVMFALRPYITRAVSNIMF